MQDHYERRVSVAMRVMDVVKSNIKETNIQFSRERDEALRQLLYLKEVTCVLREKESMKERYEMMLAMVADKNEKMMNAKEENCKTVREERNRLADEVKKAQDRLRCRREGKGGGA